MSELDQDGPTELSFPDLHAMGQHSRTASKWRRTNLMLAEAKHMNEASPRLISLLIKFVSGGLMQLC